MISNNNYRFGQPSTKYFAWLRLQEIARASPSVREYLFSTPWVEQEPEKTISMWHPSDMNNISELAGSLDLVLTNQTEDRQI